MKAHFWAADTAGSGWYRMQLPSTALAWRGHTTHTHTELTDEWRTTADVIVGSRVALPGPSILWQRMHDAGTRLVLDLDDDYWHLPPENQAARDWPASMLERLSRNMGVADVVTVVSEGLAERCRDHTDTPVEVVANALPAQLMGTVRDYHPETLRVGWAGTAATVEELPLIARALRRIADRAGVEVRLIGIGPHEAVARGAAHSNIGTFGWLRQQDYLTVASTFDVWLAPYRDTVFNQAKFPTKALEAGMLGIPLIASDIRPYREWIEHGVTGFLVKHDHEWGRYLKQLVDDPALRQSIGNTARAHASSHILQTMNQRWEQVLTPAGAHSPALREVYR